MRPVTFIFVVLALCVPGLALAQADDRADDRDALVEVIRREVSATSGYLGRTALDPRVIAALSRVPRHRFVPQRLAASAYDNRPLPIGHGQTISQPYIVAIMTDLLHLDGNDRVLEIGTGSGYQAAVLAEVVDAVFSIEIVEPLAERSSRLLGELGYDSVETRFGDGYYGWQSEAPFDAIIVTAAASHVPPPLLEQLAPGGRLIIPVGSRFMVQQLVLVEKSESGELSLRQILPVRFVPLTGDHD